MTFSPRPPAALRAGSLCTGYGGLDLAVAAVTGARLAWVAETSPHAAALRLLIGTAVVAAPAAGGTQAAA